MSSQDYNDAEASPSLSSSSSSSSSSSTSSLSNIQIPKSLEKIDNANEIWKTIKKRFPKTAPLFNELEESLDRAKNLVKIIKTSNYQDLAIQVSSSTIEDNISLKEEDKIDEKNVSIDKSPCQSVYSSDDVQHSMEIASLKEWEGFGNYDTINPSLLSIKNTKKNKELLEAANQIEKIEAICPNNSRIIDNIIDKTMTTIAVIKNVDKICHLQPTITTKEAFFGPAQERVSSNAEIFHKEKVKFVKENIDSPNLSPRDKNTDRKSPSRIPKKTSRINEVKNPGKITTNNFHQNSLRSGNSRIKNLSNFSNNKLSNIKTIGDNKSPNNSAREKIKK